MVARPARLRIRRRRGAVADLSQSDPGPAVLWNGEGTMGPASHRGRAGRSRRHRDVLPVEASDGAVSRFAARRSLGGDRRRIRDRRNVEHRSWRARHDHERMARDRVHRGCALLRRAGTFDRFGQAAPRLGARNGRIPVRAGDGRQIHVRRVRSRALRGDPAARAVDVRKLARLAVAGVHVRTRGAGRNVGHCRRMDVVALEALSQSDLPVRKRVDQIAMVGRARGVRAHLRAAYGARVARVPVHARIPAAFLRDRGPLSWTGGFPRCSRSP